MEIPADRLGGHCAGAARLLLPRLLLAARGTGIDVAVRRSREARAAAFASVAARGVCAAAGWLRNEDGAGAHAHLETGCVWRSAGAGGRAAGRRCHELRVSGDPAILSDLPGRERNGVRERDHDFRRAVVDGRGRGVHGPAARLQADAGLLQRRAHGHSGIGHRHRRIGDVRRAVAPAHQRGDQGRAVSIGGQHPPRLRQQTHR